MTSILLTGGARARRCCMAAWLALAVGVGAHAQVAPLAPVPATASVTAPASTSGLPGASTLPAMPSDNRLPGPDPRQCGSTRWSALCAEGRWSNFARMRVQMKAPVFVGVYTMEQPANRDVHTTYRETHGKTRRGGEVVFVNDDTFAYRSRDRFASADTMLDEMMSSPILVTQLAALLLDLGALVGPDEITKPLDIAARNATQYLRTEAPAMAALFGPPWDMTGSVRPADNGELAFRLRLSHRPVDGRGRLHPTQRDVVELVGTVGYGDRRKSMSDTFDLVGWKLVNRGNTMDPVKTMEEARQAVGGR